MWFKSRGSNFFCLLCRMTENIVSKLLELSLVIEGVIFYIKYK